MREIKVEALTHDAFAPFGTFYNMLEPDGYPLCGELHRFYPDRIVNPATKNMAISPLTVKKPDTMHITQIEYHTTTGEMILPMTDDVVLHVAPPSAGKPAPEYTKAFIIPKGTVVKINACVWHLCPLPVHDDTVTCLIMLPECTYINDCVVVDLKEDEQFTVVL